MADMAYVLLLIGGCLALALTLRGLERLPVIVANTGGVEVHLTPTEWGVLEPLVRDRGKPAGQRELLRAVWGPGYGKETNHLRVYLANMRRKLEVEPPGPGT